MEARRVILANGLSKNKVLERENEFLDKGVSYCATCDGPLYRKKQVLVIEDSAHAEEDVNYLSEICDKVYEIQRIKLVTARKYVQMTEEDIRLLDSPKNYKKRKTVVDDYLNIIYKMLYDKIDPAVILSYVLRMGYDGNLKTLENYIAVLAKNNFNNSALHINWAYKTEYPKEITVSKCHQILSSILRKSSGNIDTDGIKEYIEIIKNYYEIVSLLEDAYYSR
ncbi:thioredoxin-disulfide reductase [Cellulosilyticum ruminicola]|uniref:hypothetical protein n=1 Tax=Cellulosilyticum ruminicola TaxID=425254 RepID=UPI001582A9FB|nr:hypothetical protein [Cellulosilyticum ruminicola]